jgi:homoserine O-acetyltransferase
MSLLGPGNLVDTPKYFVVPMDSLGNGISSSPSNAGPDSLAFPRFTDLSVWDRQGEDIKVHLP